jgi:hypothetical protein
MLPAGALADLLTPFCNVFVSPFHPVFEFFSPTGLPFQDVAIIVAEMIRFPEINTFAFRPEIKLNNLIFQTNFGELREFCKNIRKL